MGSRVMLLSYIVHIYPHLLLPLRFHNTGVGFVVVRGGGGLGVLERTSYKFLTRGLTVKQPFLRLTHNINIQRPLFTHIVQILISIVNFMSCSESCLILTLLFLFRRIIVRLVSMAGTGYYYMMTRNRLKPKLEFMKHDPIGKQQLKVYMTDFLSYTI